MTDVLQAALEYIKTLPHSYETSRMLANLEAQLAGECVAYARAMDVEADVADLERRFRG